LFILISLVSVSCTKDNDSVYNDNGIFHQTKNQDCTIQLGKQLIDPYQLENMKSAFNNLVQNGLFFPVTELSATGTYIRALAKNVDDLDKIEEDTTIVWFQYPLNYEIVVSGSYYYDNTLPDSSWQWLYAVIPYDYNMPDSIQYEVIYNVFIPDDHPLYYDYEDVFDSLESKSIELCGYSESTTTDKRLSKSISKWTPSATIQVWDDLTEGYQPLEGVRVKAHTWCKNGRGVTNELGTCTVDKKFRIPVEYSIEWRRHFWRVVNNKNKEYTLCGPTKRTDWTLSLSNTDECNYVIANIHKAAMIAYYKNVWSVYRPKRTNWLGCIKKLNIRYTKKSTEEGLRGESSAHGENLGNADIEIYGRDFRGIINPSQDLFATTIHELSHWSHRLYYDKEHSNGDYQSAVNGFISESWASCIEWFITTTYYSGHYGTTGYRNGFQSWNRYFESSHIYYTPIFIDLIDSYNQHSSNSSTPNDNISEYTLPEIQNNILRNSYNLNSLKTALYNNKLHNTTDADISKMVEEYEYITEF